MTDTTPHKQKLLSYFDGQGFERWSAIYGDAKLSGVRQTIREGHTVMLSTAVEWLAEAAQAHTATRQGAQVSLAPWNVLDAGCGTGLLTVALARQGMRVTSFDLAPNMAQATQQAAQQAGVGELVSVRSGDIDLAEGSYDAVACLDVLIHYPLEDFERMLARLAGMARERLVVTYAPHEPLLAALHWLGGRAPQANRRTDIQMISERRFTQALANCGLRVRRTARISRGFYHVALIEAGRV
jgi:magnesium-protoporphyrin O-methyltransferase